MPQRPYTPTKLCLKNCNISSPYLRRKLFEIRLLRTKPLANFTKKCDRVAPSIRIVRGTTLQPNATAKN